jgi:phenylalanyl-tRNA synthetase beta chain
MILDGLGSLVPGTSLLELLSIEPDLVLDISPEGNRPDAWSVEGVARDVAVRLGQSIRPVALASPNTVTESSSAASCAISSPELCGMLTLGVLEHVTVADSPRWIQQRLTAAGMRPVNNVVDASNYVMLELGQPTHPYDAALVAGRHLGVRRATSGETLRTLDGTDRVLGETGRGLGDTGIDCVIVDGDDVVIGLGGIMGGATSVITAATTEVLVEAAFFDPMTIARTSKRLGLRSEASNRFERGVDPTLASRALGRFVTLLRESSPELEFLATPVVASGTVPIPPTVTMTHDQLFNLLGTNIALDEAAVLLRGISFEANVAGDVLTATAPPSRLDVREGIAGRADVIEEIARLYSYGRLVRRTPTWVEPGGLTWRQQFRRRVRDAVVGLGFLEAWTASFVSDADFDLVTSSPLRVRVTNPLSAEESLLRSSLLVGLTRAWGRNVERGVGDVALFEMGTVVDHPGWSDHPRETRGGRGGSEKIELPTEHEMLLMVLGRPDDDARTAAATWHVMAERWELRDVVVRSAPAPSGWHPTRFAQLVDRATENGGRPRRRT